MNDAPTVRVPYPRNRLGEDGKAVAQREPVYPIEKSFERIAVHELHNHERVVALGMQRIERGDVGMVEVAQTLRFDMEAIDKIAVTAQLRAQHLDRDRASEDLVVRRVDLTDPAFAEEALQFIRSDCARRNHARPPQGLLITLL